MSQVPDAPADLPFEVARIRMTEDGALYADVRVGVIVPVLLTLPYPASDEADVMGNSADTQ
jgi:hypothetical protein